MIRKFVLGCFISLLLFLVHANPGFAQFHEQNNKIGVHLISPSHEDIRDACRMVNANGGSWGWLTLPIREGEFSVQALQEIHDVAAEEECIIVHRMATPFDSNGVWQRPTDSTYTYFPHLLSEVRTSTKPKFAIWLNETNHGAEFGGVCDPTEYGKTAVRMAKALKEADPNIVFMLNGLDLAAPEARPNFCDAAKFYREMILNVPDVFENVDALASHCYPANFTGSPNTNGRRSIMCYQWEKSYLSSLGVKKANDFKAFITETSWKSGPGGIPVENAAANMRVALSRWQNSDVFSVTPFAFKFLTPPFNEFSLVNESNQRNEVGEAIYSSAKNKGEPIHDHRSTCAGTFPKNLVENVEYEVSLECRNNGTDIWKGLSGDYDLVMHSPFQSNCSTFHTVKPGAGLNVNCVVNPGGTSGCPTVRFVMTKNGKPLMTMSEVKMCVKEPPTLSLKTIKRFPGLVIDDEVVTIQVFKEDSQKLIFQTEAQVSEGNLRVEAVEGVNFDDLYRVVVIRAGSLPVQIVHVRWLEGINEHNTPIFLAIDTNEDGQFSLSDVLQAYNN